MSDTIRYGFYGDVITESEKFRWMGPRRYDYAGTKVFLKHRHVTKSSLYFVWHDPKSKELKLLWHVVVTIWAKLLFKSVEDVPELFSVSILFSAYQAEVAYLEVKTEETNSTPEIGNRVSLHRVFRKSNIPERVVCRVNCNICSTKPIDTSTCGSTATTCLPRGEKRWQKSKGRFLSVGAAIISCRNEKAPDGLVADAHLSDGFLHLILIKDCPHAFYLW